MISRHFPAISVALADKPLTLPPGRARLAMSPVPTGSPAGAMTIGIWFVARFAACTAGVWEATMTSTFRRTSSAAKSGRRVCFPSAPQFDYYVLTLNISKFMQPFAERAPKWFRTPNKKHTYPWHLCLLRASNEWPRKRYSAKCADEVSPPH